MKDLTNSIERVAESEAVLGIRLNALSAFIDDEGDLKICGEAIFNQPPNQDNSAQVNVLLYDGKSRVVSKEDTYIGSAGVPFDAFEINAYEITHQIVKIKIFLSK